MKIVLAVILTGSIIFTIGCGDSVEQVKPVDTECGPCVGGACKISDKPVAQSKMPFNPIPSAEQLMSANKSKVPVKTSALAGKSGNYNDVKLPGMAHDEMPQEQSFFVRTFKSNLWPGGVELGAEVDPDIVD